MVLMVAMVLMLVMLAMVLMVAMVLWWYGMPVVWCGVLDGAQSAPARRHAHMCAGVFLPPAVSISPVRHLP